MTAQQNGDYPVRPWWRWLVVLHSSKPPFRDTPRGFLTRRAAESEARLWRLPGSAEPSVTVERRR